MERLTAEEIAKIDRGHFVSGRWTTVDPVINDLAMEIIALKERVKALEEKNPVADFTSSLLGK